LLAGGANLQSHAFSQTYGAILPTSLTYIDLLARGFSPWRPAAVIGTSYGGIILSVQWSDVVLASFSFQGLIVKPRSGRARARRRTPRTRAPGNGYLRKVEVFL